jgi:hypothetical protein
MMLSFDTKTVEFTIYLFTGKGNVRKTSVICTVTTPAY